MKIGKGSDMEVEFRISEADYVNASRLYWRLRPGLVLRLALIAVIIVLGSLLMPSLLQSAVLGGLIGAAVAIVLGRSLFGPWQARRHYRKYPAMHEPFRIALKEEGVELSTPDADGLVKWDKILKWRQNDDYLLLFPMPRLFYIIPKSISEHGFDFARLETQLQSKVGKEA